jgi:lipoate-protein ligase A
VLQGPGCLNYALILRIEEQGPLGTVSATNRWVLERNGAALDRLIAKPECGSGARDGAEGPVGKAHVTRVGHTDLALNSLKFSGNSQRRRRRFLLFHGTCLLRFDLGRVARLLPMPTREPAYRRHRPHLDFLTNLDLPAAAVKAELRREWGAVEPLESAPLEAIGLLARDKYATAAWNLKF